MRKLYALLAGLAFFFASVPAHSRTLTPDIADFSFIINPGNNVAFANNSILGSEPGNRQAYWSFGDGNGLVTGPLEGAQHHYVNPGTYTVCLKIYRFTNIPGDSVLSAQICKTLVIQQATCTAGFEVAPTSPGAAGTYFIATPGHTENKKPFRICWTFGDGTDTCIQYANTFTGPYAVFHHYAQPGTYTVCVNIQYDGGCVANSCRPVVITGPATCQAGFEVPLQTPNPLGRYFIATPSHSQNKKPVRVCWTFGDGRDTCIQYATTYTGAYGTFHQYNQPGTYNVCVNILYDGGCEATNCRPVIVNGPDSCHADFERIQVAGTNSPLSTYFNALPWHSNNKKPVRICWTFGDGRDTCIQYTTAAVPPYPVHHTYTVPGTYTVCVNILYDGGCQAQLCKPVVIGVPDSCRADFERIAVTPASNPLTVVYKALPWNSNNRKPARVCWNFGDGRDTCITYLNIYNGLYTVPHTYLHPGLYNVCVSILYYGGCEAQKCKPIQVGRVDSCGADFQRIQTTPGTNPNGVYFQALPIHNNNRKPSRVCWTFGDGRDTCINYSETFTGAYAVFHQYAHNGLYEVCVNIQYFGGCEARKCKLIQVGPADSCSADFERAPVTSATPYTQGFHAITWNSNNRKPARICWTFGDGRDTCITYPETFTGIYAVTHRYLQPGQYEVCVNILYYGGCEAHKCKPIVIPPIPTVCNVQLVEITPSITSLVRGFFALPNVTPAHRLIRLCWHFGDGTDTCVTIDPTAPMPLGGYFMRHTYPAPGVYRACVTALFEGGCLAESCREVVIRGAANLCGGYVADSLVGPRTFLFKGFSIHAPNDQVISFTWSFGDGTSQTGQNVTHTYTQSGDFRVCLLIRTQLGCETRICKTVRVPGNNEPALHLSPNPVISVVHVNFFSTHTETVLVRIINPFGVVVRTYNRPVTTGPNNWDIDLSTLPSGVYSFVVQSPNQLASAIFFKQ